MRIQTSPKLLFGQLGMLTPTGSFLVTIWLLLHTIKSQATELKPDQITKPAYRCQPQTRLAREFQHKTRGAHSFPDPCVMRPQGDFLLPL